MLFGGVHKKDSKITFLFDHKVNLFISAEHRRRLKRAANFASLQSELNFLVKSSLIKFLTD